MAFTTTPVHDTYSSPKVPAAYDLALRPNSLYAIQSAGVTDITQDAGMVNLLPRIHKTASGEEIYAVTRPNVNGQQIVASTDWIHGFHVWQRDTGTIHYFVVLAAKIYSANSVSGPWTLVNTFTGASVLPARFCEFIDATNVKKLFVCDGSEAFVFTSNAAGTKVTDADFPSPHVAFPVFLDGRIYVAKAGTGDIYCSDLNDPLSWTAGNFISSELYPDDIQALVRMNNYILAIGAAGCEYFYDAGNFPGSPLARYEGASLPFGTKYPDAIAYSPDKVVLLADTQEGGASVRMIEGFKVHELPDGPMTQAMAARIPNAVSPCFERGFFMHINGDLIYGINLNGNIAFNNSNGNKCFIFHFPTKMWTEFRISYDQPWPVQFTAPSVTSGSPSTFVAGYIGGRAYAGQLNETKVNATDNLPLGNIDIYTEIRTPALDFETMNIKTMSRMGIDATVNDSSNFVYIGVAWSDDDYTTYNSGVVDIGAPNNFPFVTQLGRFRKRSFKITYQGTVFITYKHLTFDINKGQK